MTRSNDPANHSANHSAEIERMRRVMESRPGITEKRMFGSLFWMLNGNMLCAVGKHGFMFRVGAEREEEALLRQLSAIKKSAQEREFCEKTRVPNPPESSFFQKLPFSTLQTRVFRRNSLLDPSERSSAKKKDRPNTRDGALRRKVLFGGLRIARRTLPMTVGAPPKGRLHVRGAFGAGRTVFRMKD